MSITRRVTFRLYPSKAQNEKLHYWRKLHKLLYNACISQRSTQYKQFSQSIDYFDQQNCLPEFKQCWIEYKELGSHALQATVKRVDYAFQRFFQLKSGYPKFKSSRRYSGNSQGNNSPIDCLSKTCSYQLLNIGFKRKSDRALRPIISGSVKQLNVMADGEIGKWGNRERFSLK
jgi:transposase